MKPSACCLVALVAFVVLWDVAALVLGGTPHTFTGVVRELAESWPWLAPLTLIAMVLLWGHLFLDWL